MSRPLPDSPWVIRAATYAANRDAQQIRATAEAEAAQLLAEAAVEAEQLRTAGYQQGLAAGSAEMASLLVEANRQLQACQLEQQGELLELVLATAYRVLSAIPEQVRLPQMALDCLTEHFSEQHLIVRVSGAGAPLLRAALSAHSERIEVIADPAIAAGEGVLIHRAGRTEFGLKAQFRAMLTAGDEAHG